MKILLINSVCGIRSTGKIVSELADRYTELGDECAIAYGREACPPKYQAISYRIGTDFEVKANALKARSFDNEAFNAKAETKRLIKFANSYNPDVLWLHNLHGYYINIELLFNWIKSRPQMHVKWTLHDCWAFTGHCAHFDFIGCDKWKTGCKNCPQIKEYPKSLLVDNSVRNYKRKKAAFTGVENMTLITPSNWLAGLVKESFLKDYPVKVVNNTIDKSVFKPTEGSFREENGLQGKTIVLGVASAWGERKGLQDFVKLSSELGEESKIVLVGLTRKQIKQMPSNILCIERTDSKRRLAEIYTAADVFVNLTYEDTYPTVNLEALACGTPCISYNTGGSVESVSADCVVPKGDIAALTAKIKEITKG